MDTLIGTQQYECIERRSRIREADGWHKATAWLHAYKRDMHGHHLVIYKPNSCHYGIWFKYIDGHFRGHVSTLKLAKEQLEREAAGEMLAWGPK